MILIRGEEYNRDRLDELLLFLKDISVTKEKKEFYSVYKEYLEGCYETDVNLQKDVDSYIGNGLISYIEIPSEEIDDFTTIKFFLKKKDGSSIKKRENLLYKKLCEKRLKNFKDMISLLDRKL